MSTTAAVGRGARRQANREGRGSGFMGSRFRVHGFKVQGSGSGFMRFRVHEVHGFMGS
jgi:hypothetical protein